jgi:hypothetical protein
LAEEFSLRGYNFVLAPQWGEVPYYRLHLEGASAIDEPVRRRLAERFERKLQSVNIEYASKRASGRLAPVCVNALPERWLTEHDQQTSTRQRPTNEQFKHRYLLSEIGSDGHFPLENHVA